MSSSTLKDKVGTSVVTTREAPVVLWMAFVVQAGEPSGRQTDNQINDPLLCRNKPLKWPSLIKQKVLEHFSGVSDWPQGADVERQHRLVVG